jgi:REP element-mobilizing transposase RayT
MTTKLPQRKSPRAKWLDYNEGEYFVTVCTHNWIHYFGEIVDGKMQLSQMGHFLTECLENTKKHQQHINILQYVVMPNHFHAIIEVEQTDTACRVPTCEERVEKEIQHYRQPLLSTYIGSLKSAVTKYAHMINGKFMWQKRYHVHAIRGTEDRNNISQYIENNIISWENDCFNEQT